jgi:leader peptidase (prepilin peptidase)/N-methyltransferase
VTITDLLRQNPALLTGCVFLFSLLVGSFLNVVIHRLPKVLERQWRAQADEMLGRDAEPATEPYNLLVPRSRCPACGAEIKAHQNVPVIS